MTTKSVNRIYSDIDLNFLAHPVTGDVSKKYDVDAVKQSLKTLILTNYYERPFQPKLGSPVYGMMFEHVDVPSSNSLKLRLEMLINQFTASVAQLFAIFCSSNWIIQMPAPSCWNRIIAQHKIF